jgi:hypothetical protein
VSEALTGAKLRYTELEKLSYAVVMASRKLKHYFTSHPVSPTGRVSAPLGGTPRKGP